MLISDIDFGDVTFVWEKARTSNGWKVYGFLPDTGLLKKQFLFKIFMGIDAFQFNKELLKVPVLLKKSLQVKWEEK